MEFVIVEESKNRMLFHLKGEDHTFCNALKQQLVDNEDVKIASYKIEHPLIGHPLFILETKSKDPKKVIMDSAKELQKELEKFKKAL